MPRAWSVTLKTSETVGVLWLVSHTVPIMTRLYAAQDIWSEGCLAQRAGVTLVGLLGWWAAAWLPSRAFTSLCTPD